MTVSPKASVAGCCARDGAPALWRVQPRLHCVCCGCGRWRARLCANAVATRLGSDIRRHLRCAAAATAVCATPQRAATTVVGHLTGASYCSCGAGPQVRALRAALPDSFVASGGGARFVLAHKCPDGPRHGPGLTRRIADAHARCHRPARGFARFGAGAAGALHGTDFSNIQ